MSQLRDLLSIGQNVYLLLDEVTLLESCLNVGRARAKRATDEVSLLRWVMNVFFFKPRPDINSRDISKRDFLVYLALDVTANCICEIRYLALDGFDLNAVHKLSSKGKNISAQPGFEPMGVSHPAALCDLWATPLPSPISTKNDTDYMAMKAAIVQLVKDLNPVRLTIKW